MLCTHLATYLGSLKVRTAKFLQFQTDLQVEVFAFLCFCGGKKIIKTCCTEHLQQVLTIPIAWYRSISTLSPPNAAL